MEGSAWPSSAQPGPALPGPAQLGLAQLGPAQLSPAQAGPAHPGPAPLPSPNSIISISDYSSRIQSPAHLQSPGWEQPALFPCYLK